MLKIKLGVVGGLVLVSGLAASAQAAPVVGLSFAGDRLVTFNTTDVNTLTSNVAVSGLASSEKLLTIDVRPATGEVYALSNQNRLYTVNPNSGAATQVLQAGAAPFTLNGSVGMDFNPAADRLRVTTSTGQNLRLNPITGGQVADDSAANGLIRYDASDANAGVTPRAVSVAYTNSTIGAPRPTSTTMYVIDAQSGFSRFLANQGSVGGTPVSPNSGLLFNSKSVFGLFVGDEFGFDIATVGGTDMAILSGQTLIGTTAIYSFDLSNGAIGFWGAIGNGALQVRDITVIPTPGAAMAAGIGGLALATRRRRG